MRASRSRHPFTRILHTSSQRGVLKDHVDRLPHAGRVDGDVVPGQPGPAAGRPEQGREHVGGRALAGAVRAEEAEGFARMDLEVDGLDGGEGAEVLAESRHFDDGSCRARGYPRRCFERSAYRASPHRN